MTYLILVKPLHGFMIEQITFDGLKVNRATDKACFH